MKRGRPELRIEIGDLGTVDPFGLKMVERPPRSGRFRVEDPKQAGKHTSLECAGLSLAGAGQALLTLSLNWMDRAGEFGVQEGLPGPGSVAGEVRLLVKRREARLLAAVLRRHLARLPQAPDWMADLLGSLEQIDDFLRWEEG